MKSTESSESSPSSKALQRIRSTASVVGISCTLACAALCLAGCAGTRFGVDGIKNQRVAEQKVSYVIRSANPEVPETSAEFQREAAFVKTALSSRGFYEAPPGAPVDMVVEIDCGMEAPKTKTITYREKTYETVTEMRTTQVTRNQDGTFSGGESYTVVRDVVKEGPPQTEIITTYPKFLRITARETPEAAGDHPPREVWSVYVTNEDKSDDLEAYEPLLVAAAMDKIDEDTRGEIRVVLKPQDERVKFVKNGS